MRVTRRQLRRIIKEAITLRETIEVFNGDTGEIIELEDDQLLHDMGIEYRVTPDGSFEIADGDFWDLDNRVNPPPPRSTLRTQPYRRDPMPEAPYALMDKVRDWAADAREDFMSGNYGVSGDLSDYAPDMARSIRWELTEDEWEQLVDHFDDEWAVYDFVADSIV